MQLPSSNTWIQVLATQASNVASDSMNHNGIWMLAQVATLLSGL
jgi:hypothetical protein